MGYKIKDPIWDGVTLKIFRLYLKTWYQLLSLTNRLPQKLLRGLYLTYEIFPQQLIQFHLCPRFLILVFQVFIHILVDVFSKALPVFFKLIYVLLIFFHGSFKLFYVFPIQSLIFVASKNDLLVYEPLLLLEFHLVVELG